MTPPYRARLFAPADRRSLEDLYRAVYGEAWRRKTNFAWTLDRPLAAGGAAVVVQGDVVVSAQPFCDLPLRTPRGRSAVTLFLDVATHPAHQRRGLFKLVVGEARRAAFERGASIVMTTPNRAAFQGFMTMPEWRRLCVLDCLVRPIGAGHRAAGAGLVAATARAALGVASRLWFTRRARPPASAGTPCQVQAAWSPDAEADALWHRAAPQSGFIVTRDRSFLGWRFGPDYRLFLARDSRGPGGYAAARVLTRSGLKVGMVVDAMAADGSCALPLFEAVTGWMRQQGASAAIGYFRRGSDAWSLARAAGFASLPGVLVPRPYPVCVSVRSEAPDQADLLDPSRWHLSLADSDLA
jgi:GNAT superfamily N-acetyltransferase